MPPLRDDIVAGRVGLLEVRVVADDEMPSPCSECATKKPGQSLRASLAELAARLCARAAAAGVYVAKLRKLQRSIFDGPAPAQAFEVPFCLKCLPLGSKKVRDAISEETAFRARRRHTRLKYSKLIDCMKSRCAGGERRAAARHSAARRPPRHVAESARARGGGREAVNGEVYNLITRMTLLCKNCGQELASPGPGYSCMDCINVGTLRRRYKGSRLVACSAT